MTSRTYPVLDMSWAVKPDEATVELLLAELDAAGPTAVEGLPTGVRVFFATAKDRDTAAAVARRIAPPVSVAASSVADESWAERSQASLGPITVGDVVVAPPWAIPVQGDTPRHVVAIQPSTGFGTGHHASTRLCLALLQRCRLNGRSVLDVGTGSGVLALAAWRLGAATVLAIDADPDALGAARENVARNGAGTAIALRLADVTRDPVPIHGAFDVVVANLTGAMLARVAPTLAGWLQPDGALIVGGLLESEHHAVVEALSRTGLKPFATLAESGWLSLSASPTTSRAH